jgi:hypothetical protein
MWLRPGIGIRPEEDVEPGEHAEHGVGGCLVRAGYRGDGQDATADKMIGALLALGDHDTRPGRSRRESFGAVQRQRLHRGAVEARLAGRPPPITGLRPVRAIDADMECDDGPVDGADLVDGLGGCSDAKPLGQITGPAAGRARIAKPGQLVRAPPRRRMQVLVL